jgi:hypothetical protein
MNGTARLCLQDASSALKRTRSRYNGCVEILLAVGLGIGLASVAGVRAFLPLALAALFTLFGLFASFGFVSTFVGVEEPILAVVLGVLAVVEIVLDKLRAVERTFNYIMVPVRAVSGALLFTAAVGPLSGAGPVPWLIAGAVVAGAVAAFKVVLRPSASEASSGVSTSFLSLIEDAVGLVGGILALFVPLVPAALAAFLLFFYARIRKRRGRKFGGLRILGD